MNVGYGTIWFEILTAAIKFIALAIGFGMGLASILTWMERRESAMMQDRLGPNRAFLRIPIVGWRWRAWGLIHFIADALKFMTKEDFVPPGANKLLFSLGPVLAIAPAVIVSAIIPFGPTLCLGELGTPVSQLGVCARPVAMQVAHLDAGILFYFAIASLSVYGLSVGGWASANKFATLGSLRAASQMMSYEVTMGMAILGAFLVYGTLEPGAIVDRQVDFWHWGIITQPVGFLLFFTAAIAETKRTPFDLPEGEPEIVGYFVEFSGLRFGMFYLAEFLEVVFSSALIVTVFLGGWRLPATIDGLLRDLPLWAYVVIGIGVWSVKVFVFCWFQLLIRWTLPRFRPDQLMQLGWQRLLPLSIANVVVTAFVMMFVH